MHNLITVQTLNHAFSWISIFNYYYIICLNGGGGGVGKLEGRQNFFAVLEWGGNFSKHHYGEGGEYV